MAHFNRLGGIVREMHHIKVVDPDNPSKKRFERTMVIYRPMLKGRSFYIPDSCGWKYIDPKDNHDILEQDLRQFEELKQDCIRSAMLNPGQDFSLEVSALELASLFHIRSGITRITAYSLIKCCQLLDITIDGPAIYQLLNFIQDGLRDLQKMPPPIQEEETEVGELRMALNRGGDVKTWDTALTVREGEAKTGVIGG